MIAIDLDGTLLSASGKVSARTKAAVHAALKSGLLICFATGRNWTESREVLKDLAHYSTAVFAGGAMVIDTDQEVTLHRTMMNSQIAREISALLESMGHAVLALQDTHAAGVDYLVSQDVPLNQATTAWMAATHARIQRVSRLSDHPHAHTVRLGIVAPAQEVEEAMRQLREKFGARLFCQSLRLPISGLQVLEIFDPAVNKWQGVLHVARRHQIKPQEIVAIGDDINDVPMLRGAGLGVAMGNARPEIQAQAQRVIGSNTDEGLAIFLEELIAQHAVRPDRPTVP
jgi:Cof subfamily protein (haloacid dehalogenase superfamily)